MKRKYLPITVIFLISVFFRSAAINPEFYTPSSVLSEGRWVKVLVKESGMQFVSNATLRSLGFSNPDKVNVYGYGGRMLPEKLDQSTPDDLPAVVSLRTPAGIVFFGHSSVSWVTENSGLMKFAHTINPYSEDSFYFLSDREMERPVAKDLPDFFQGGTQTITTFTERQVYEKDILAPYNSGRTFLGEDFRVQNTRNFLFQLPDNTGDANFRVSFGTKVTNGSSKLSFLANGTALDPSDTDNIPGITNSEVFLTLRSTTKTVKEPGDKLNLTVNYSHAGTLFTAALNFIEVEYERQLRLNNDELYFYLDASETSRVNIEGCNEQTVIWDVTDPVSPSVVNYELSGTVAGFSTGGGYREFVAFNPDKVSRSVTSAGVVKNQNLHGLEAPGMLVVAPDRFRSQAERLASLHASYDGLKVTVVSPEEVYNEFSSGNPDVTAFRRLLKMWYDRAGGDPSAYTKFCILFSRPTFDNKMVTPEVKKAGYPRIPIWQEPGYFSESGSYSTDDYIGMLEDQSDALNMGRALIHVAVARMPVKTVAEAETAVTKLENYLLKPDLGAWRNNIMVIADDQDGAQHLDQAEKVIEAMRGGENGKNVIYEKLYLDSYPLKQSGQGPIYPEAKQRMMDKINEGVALIDYIGHAATTGWGHENLLTWTDINSMSNQNLPFIYAATCSFMQWDANEITGAETLWLNPTAGVIGMICPNRKVYISSNGDLNIATASGFFARGADGLPLPLGEIMIQGKNKRLGETNKLRYGFMGDPSLRLPYPSLEATVDEINGVKTESAVDFPELKARSHVSLSGSVRDANGAIAEDFDGVIRIQLFDAEKVVETLGNGSEGEVRTYNDRKTRLFIGNVKVNEGKWATSFIMPSEIENNYSPALISLYGFDSTGKEVNGSTERLYVYGFDENVEPDNDGPLITDFYLNAPGFTDGSFTGPSPMLYATLSDASGINLSEAGIGHKMTVSIDGKDIHDDVNLYYTPDNDTFEKGSIAYPLQGVTPGNHTLTLTVWDSANNSSSATLNFGLKADWQPSITQLSTDVGAASASVTFTLATDGALGNMPSFIEVFDLNGRRVWKSEEISLTEKKNVMTCNWNLHTSSGQRIPRGIYLYRGNVTTEAGHLITKTRKFAVSATK